jgi:hypothetical protein
MEEMPQQKKAFADQDGSVESQENFNFSDLTIFTTTLYKDDPVSRVRENLARKFIENAEKLNIQLVIVDGGSNEYFINYVRSKPHVELIVEAGVGMGKSRRDALQVAMDKYNTLYYFWVEPEKDDLIRPESLTAMIDGLRKDETDIVVPRRSNKESMPAFQTWIENRANKKANRIMEKMPDETLDLWFGPKMFNRKGAEHFLNYKGQLDKWDSIIKPVIEAHRNGQRISSVDVCYTYDESQTSSEKEDREMKRKRIQQYTQILAELGDEFLRNKLSEKISK